MLYLRCPTCNKLLGDKQLAWEEMLNKLSLMDDITQDQIKEVIQKFFEEHHVDRYCCRARFPTYVDKVTLIK
jgi:DNA-directed RNA polymerase subunit N (RpoN/RPB10)